MPYIIAEPCVGTCDTACVEVCPVDCIHGPYDKEGRGEEAKVRSDIILSGYGFKIFCLKDMLFLVHRKS